ncbi:MAG: hypothetical protein ABIQ04_04225 [Candidatus Saccharimonadales bacterium]
MSTIRRELRTYRDRAEYLKLAVTKRRRLLKLRAIATMGSSCVICHYDKHPGVLDFHHVDPTSKLFAISGGGFSRSWSAIELEIKKCILVCANCHREIELGLHKKEAVEKLFQQLHFQKSTNKHLAPAAGLEPAT